MHLEPTFPPQHVPVSPADRRVERALLLEGQKRAALGYRAPELDIRDWRDALRQAQYYRGRYDDAREAGNSAMAGEWQRLYMVWDSVADDIADALFDQGEHA